MHLIPQAYLSPSEARDLAGEWLEPFPGKVPRSLRSLGGHRAVDSPAYLSITSSTGLPF